MKHDQAAAIRKRVAGLFAKLTGKNSRSTVDGCFLGTLGIMQILYGANSEQAKALFEAKKGFTKTQYTHVHELDMMGRSLHGALRNILEEIDAGLIKNIATEAAGTVIGNLTALAKEELQAGYTNVAAVLACAALEDALKRKAEELGISVDGKTMDSIINALKAKSFFRGPQVPIVKSYVKLRNAAMHANWDRIQDADVSSLIGFLEPFLIANFT